jgi:hypothetical protein
MAVPNIFGSATSAIPLSQLDQNFATAITLGNTAVYLGNTTTSLGNVTLTNVTISSGNVSVSTATVGAGSNTAPSITTTGDTNTGIFFPAADTIAFSEGGVEAMRLDSAGNMGLGVTPNAWNSGWKGLQVVSSSLTNNGFNDVYLGTNFVFDSTSTSKYIVNDFAALYGQVSGTHIWSIAASGTAGNTITFTQAMTLDASGRLGITETSPAYKVDVKVSTAGSIVDLLRLNNAGGSNGGGAGLVFEDAGARAKVAGVVFGANENAGLGLGFYTGTDAGGSVTERARIDLSGRLLVGVNTAPDTAARGVFNSSSGATIVVSSSVLGNGNSAYFSARNIDTVRRDCDIGVYKHAGITNSCGYVGYVEEEGTAQYTWVGNDGNLRISTDPGAIGTNGGTVVGTQSSDERIKNIVGEVQYGLNEILALEPIAFAMKDSPDNKKLGFSAQQVQPIIPEAVYDTGDCIDGYDVDPENKMERTPKSDRTKLSMEYTQIVPVLVKAIQEQQAIITQLQADVAALKGTP